MGIDIYARWKTMSDKDQDKQYTGFSIHAGDVGYLREAYHGDPYATKYFVQECFEDNMETPGETQIPAKTLRERLPETLALAREREQVVYDVTDEYEIWLAQKSFVDFTKLCEAKEKETGEACTIYASY